MRTKTNTDQGRVRETDTSVIEISKKNKGQQVGTFIELPAAKRQNNLISKIPQWKHILSMTVHILYTHTLLYSIHNKTMYTAIKVFFFQEHFNQIFTCCLIRQSKPTIAFSIQLKKPQFILKLKQCYFGYFEAGC